MSTEPTLTVPPHPYPAREWIIDQILPRRVVGLLVGPPGVSKTTWAVQELSKLPLGQDILGHRVERTEVVFVSCDRSQEEHDSHCRALGVDPSTFHFHDQVISKTSIERIISGVKYAYPNASLIFIDGFARLVPDGKLNDYATVSDFLCQCMELAQKHNITILGCLHAGKAREGATYSDPRDQVCGSTAWAGYSNLMIVMQKANPKDSEDPVRIVHVLTRAGSGDFMFKLTKDKDPDGGGRLIPYEDPVENEFLGILTYWINSQDLDRQIPKREIIGYGRDTCSLSERTVERWLTRQVSDGLLLRPGKGKYQRARPM